MSARRTATSITRIPRRVQSPRACGTSPGPYRGRRQSKQPLPYSTCSSYMALSIHGERGTQTDTVAGFSSFLVLSFSVNSTILTAALDGCAQACMTAPLSSKLSTLHRDRSLMHASSFSHRSHFGLVQAWQRQMAEVALQRRG